MIRSHSVGESNNRWTQGVGAAIGGELATQLTSMIPSGSMPDGPSEPDWSRPPCEGSSAKSPSGAALAPQSLRGWRERAKGNVRVRSSGNARVIVHLCTRKEVLLYGRRLNPNTQTGGMIATWISHK